MSIVIMCIISCACCLEFHSTSVKLYMIDMDHLAENTRILYLLKDNCVMRHIAVFDVMPVYGFTGHLLHNHY